MANKDLDRIVLNLTTERGPAIPVTIATRPDGRVVVIVTEEVELPDDQIGSTDTQINLFPRQWRAVMSAIRWLTRGDAPWPAQD